MVDLAKVADLVLLLVDASFGFEMETFEFLNVLQVHGFPKVIGVLTHLDRFRESKKLRTTKKRLKQRFWTEIYQGAKLFYLSGLMNGKYPRAEVGSSALSSLISSRLVFCLPLPQLHFTLLHVSHLLSSSLVTSGLIRSCSSFLFCHRFTTSRSSFRV